MVFFPREGDKYFLQGGGRTGVVVKGRRQKGKQGSEKVMLLLLLFACEIFKVVLKKNHKI